MGTLRIRLPDSLHEAVKKLFKPEEYLSCRAEHGDKDKFLAILSKVPDAQPDPEDEFRQKT